LIVVTAGHVDHGKTSLIRCLTGTDTDRLPEEKKRGMSIDLGFAYLSLPGEFSSDETPGGEETPVDNQQVAFVDVPGHEKFVRNMIAGVSAVDAALLVIAADDGTMPQTEEHLAILRLLDVPRAIVAITKADLVDQERLAEVHDQVTALLAETRFSEAPMIDVSINDQQSIDRVKDVLLTCLREEYSAPRRPSLLDDGSYFRMSIDRQFSITGAGTVVTGTVTAGQLEVDQEVYALTGQIPLRVRGIRAQSQVANRVSAGQRCALNLVGADLKKARLQRGEWLCTCPELQPVSYFDAKVTPSQPHMILKHWTSAHLHVGASDIPCRIALLDADQVSHGGSVYARILCTNPAGVVFGDRFVLRDQSARHTIAGGIVIDSLPPRRGRSRPQRLDVIRAMDQPSKEDALQQLVDADRAGVSVNQFSLQFNMRPEIVHQLVERQLTEAVVTQPKADAWVLQRGHWLTLLTDAQDSLQSWHEENTDTLGADVEQLRRKLNVKVARPVLVDVLQHLCQQKKLTRRGAIYRVAGRESSLAADTEKFWKKMQPLYGQYSPVAPRVVELSEALGLTTPETLALLNTLVAHGRLYRVSENRYFLPHDLSQLAEVAEKLAAQQQLTVARYRDESGIGRNLVVELLEFFDRVQFTRRLGQQRTLLRSAEQVFHDE